MLRYGKSISRNVNPSSILTIKVYCTRRIKIGRRHIGGFSKRISELAIERLLLDIIAFFCVADVSVMILAYRCCLNESDSSAGNIKIKLTIDTSASPTMDDLGLEDASQAMGKALTSVGRLDRIQDGNKAFDASSNVIDRGVAFASIIQSGTSRAQQAADALGPLGDALKYLDKVIQAMDAIAAVISDIRIGGISLTAQRMTGTSDASGCMDIVVGGVQGAVGKVMKT
jgi:hypothetical protein